MSAIFGLCNVKSSSGNEIAKRLTLMSTRLNHWNADKTGEWHAENIGLGHLMLFNTLQSLKEELPFTSSAGLSITADARLDNRDVLKKHFPELGESSPDSHFILKAYEKWGMDCPKYLLGDFAFAIWDEKEQRLFCAKDQVGIKPFYYYINDGLFAFSSEIKGILSIEGVSKELDELWIADFLIRRHVDRTNTMYKAIQRLDGAHSLSFHKGQLQIHKYWDFDTKAELKFSNEAECIEAFNEKLDISVKRRLRTSYGIASELSGGLDSSAVVHHLHQQIGSNFLPFSIVPPRDEFEFLSEKKYILPFSEAKNLKVNYVNGTERDMKAALEWNLRVQDEPLRDMNGMFRDIIYKQCEEKGCRVLFSGFGGQEMVSSGLSVATELLATGHFREFWDEVKQRSKKDKENVIWNAIKFSGSVFLDKIGVDQSTMTSRARNLERNHITKLPKRPIQPAFAQKVNIEERLKRSIDVFAFKGNLRERQAKRFITPNMPFRLATCDIATRSFHLEYRYPLLDLELLEFYLALPPQYKSRNGYGRYLIRKAHENVEPLGLWWNHAGQHGASNPQVLAGEGLDDLAKELSEIPKDHPYHLYADFTKINKTRNVDFKRGADHQLYQVTPLINHLIFKKKLD